MDSEKIVFEVVFLVQLLGVGIFLVGLFQGGLTTLAFVGGFLIALAIVGLAAAVVVFGGESEHPGTPREGGRFRVLRALRR